MDYSCFSENNESKLNETQSHYSIIFEKKKILLDSINLKIYKIDKKLFDSKNLMFLRSNGKLIESHELDKLQFAELYCDKHIFEFYFIKYGNTIESVRNINNDPKYLYQTKFMYIKIKIKTKKIFFYEITKLSYYCYPSFGGNVYQIYYYCYNNKCYISMNFRKKCHNFDNDYFLKNFECIKFKQIYIKDVKSIIKYININNNILEESFNLIDEYNVVRNKVTHSITDEEFTKDMNTYIINNNIKNGDAKCHSKNFKKYYGKKHMNIIKLLDKELNLHNEIIKIHKKIIQNINLIFKIKM